jgi:multidrug/hemolysin transport system permease protein
MVVQMLRNLISRNIKKFFRDKGSLLFFLLSVVIVICFNILFLSKLQMQSIQALAGNNVSHKDSMGLIHIWFMAGLLPVAAFTSAFCVSSVLPSDYENRKTRDFRCSSGGSMVYPLSVVMGSFLLSFLIGIVFFAGYSIYIYLSFRHLFTVMQIMKIVGVLALSAFMGAVIMSFIASLFSNIILFASAGIIVEVMIGLLSGVYIPVGIFPEFIQNMIWISPFGNATALFRQILMKDSMTGIFKGVEEDKLDQYNLFYGIDMVIKNKKVEPLLSVKIILVVGVLCLLMFLIHSMVKNRKL